MTVLGMTIDHRSDEKSFVARITTNPNLPKAIRSTEALLLTATSVGIIRAIRLYSSSKAIQQIRGTLFYRLNSTILPLRMWCDSIRNRAASAHSIAAVRQTIACWSQSAATASA